LSISWLFGYVGVRSRVAFWAPVPNYGFVIKGFNGTPWLCIQCGPVSIPRLPVSFGFSNCIWSMAEHFWFFYVMPFKHKSARVVSALNTLRFCRTMGRCCIVEVARSDILFPLEISLTSCSVFRIAYVKLSVIASVLICFSFYFKLCHSMVPIQKQKQYCIWQQYQDNELIAWPRYSQYRESATTTIT